MTLAEKVKKVRKYYQLTQPQFAQRIGVTLAAVTKWESGENQLSRKNIEKICEEFSCRPSFFFNEEDDQMFQEPVTDSDYRKVLSRLSDMTLTLSRIEEKLDAVLKDEENKQA